MNYPYTYNSYSSCQVTVHSDTALSVVAFNTESSCDRLYINGTSSGNSSGSGSYSGCGSGLDGLVVSAGASLSWTADGSIESGGFKICAGGSMSNSSSDTNATTPYWASCEMNNNNSQPTVDYHYDNYCNSSAVNTHWTPEWDQAARGHSTNATKGTFEVITIGGCGCWTDGDCIYSNNFGDGDYDIDDQCMVIVHQNTTLAVMAFQAPMVNAVNMAQFIFNSVGQNSTTAAYINIGESGHHMTVRMGNYDWAPSYHSGDGSSLDGLVLPEGAYLRWSPGGSPRNITGKGFAICSAAAPDWSAMRDWSPLSETSSSTPEAASPETAPAEVFVAVTTAFSSCPWRPC